MLLASTISQIDIFNLDTGKISLEIDGYCPIILNDGKIAYVKNETSINIIKLNDIGYYDEIPIFTPKLPDVEDFCEENLTINGIQLRNGNILLINWNLTITEYDLKLKQCVQVIETKINFMETCYELKDGRIGITAIDNANIFNK